jgi:hypothetical protein
MKKLFKYLFLIISFQLFSQTGSIEGKVIFKLDSSVLPGAIVIINGTRIGSQTDIDGNFNLSKLQTGKYDLIFEYLGYGKDTIQDVIVKDNRVTNITLELPAGECFQKTNSKICPIDGKSINVIPILYGLPDRKMMRRMKKGKIKLGGCEVNGCEPNWFCKEHNKEF